MQGASRGSGRAKRINTKGYCQSSGELLEWGYFLELLWWAIFDSGPRSNKIRPAVHAPAARLCTSTAVPAGTATQLSGTQQLVSCYWFWPLVPCSLSQGQQIQCFTVQKDCILDKHCQRLYGEVPPPIKRRVWVNTWRHRRLLSSQWITAETVFNAENPHHPKSHPQPTPISPAWGLDKDSELRKWTLRQ